MRIYDFGPAAVTNDDTFLAVYRYRSPRMQTLLQERDQATEWLAAEADYAFSQLLSSISEQYEGFRDSESRAWPWLL